MLNNDDIFNYTYKMGKIVDIVRRENRAGEPVVNITLNVIRNNDVENSDLFDCAAFYRDADYVYNNFKKGDIVFVTGSTRKKTKDIKGEKRVFYEIRLTGIVNLQEVVDLHKNL